MKHIVEVENITKKYGSTVAVNNISFKIIEGEFFSLLGPSGCGKTTILRIIGGFIDQDEGSVKIDNTDMSKVPPNKRNTSMVFQNLALFPHMNVEENIIYGLKKRKLNPVQIYEKFSNMLSVVNLGGLQKRRIDQLSGGQQQRVALARSLIIEPKLLLLDEPLASLDKKLRISMRFELKEIQKRTGTTFLYVTHDQSEALTMSDTVAVMNEGKIIQSGRAEWIYNNPADKFVADFIGAGNFIPLRKEISSNGDIFKVTAEAGGTILIKKSHGYSNNKPSHVYSHIEPFNLISDKLKDLAGNNQDLSFFIRPEKIIVSKKPPCKASHPESPINQFKAKVVSRIFEGPDIRIVLFSEKIGLVTAECKNDANYEDFSENNSVYICWNLYEGTIL